MKLSALRMKHAVTSFHLWAIVSFWFQMTLEKHLFCFNVYL